jgi:hypothetical protein
MLYSCLSTLLLGEVSLGSVQSMASNSEPAQPEGHVQSPGGDNEKQRKHQRGRLRKNSPDITPSWFGFGFVIYTFRPHAV